MDNRIKDDFQTRIQIDSRMLVTRLKRGNLGKHIENVLQTEEVQRYFDERLVQHCAILAMNVSAKKRDFFLAVVEPEKLWKNLSINLANNILRNCLNLWLYEEDTSFDELIIQFVTPENIKHIIDALRDSFTNFAAQLDAMQAIPVSNPTDKRFLN
ncbi:MAG: hypothetical protein IJX99_09425 [Clostridia bacterium]|nr:hypothetical protein [Clostridia bacterium]